MLWPTAAILVTAGLLVVSLPRDAPGFRPVLARGWHDQLGRTVMAILGVACTDGRADGSRLDCLRFPPCTFWRSASSGPWLARLTPHTRIWPSEVRRCLVIYGVIVTQ